MRPGRAPTLDELDALDQGEGLDELDELDALDQGEGRSVVIARTIGGAWRESRGLDPEELAQLDARRAVCVIPWCPVCGGPVTLWCVYGSHPVVAYHRGIARSEVCRG